MLSNEDDVLIIGAGIAGLVLAQGLKYRGIPFKVFERDESLSAKHQGYRFRCEAPGLEALEETVSPEIWDLIEKTHPKDTPPVLNILDPYTGEKAREINPIADPSPRAQRCYPIDRPWIRELLYIGIEDDVVFGKAFESYTLLEKGNRKLVKVTFTDKTTATGRLVVAADGVRSRVRRQMLPGLKQVDVGRIIIWGRTPLDDSLRSNMPKDALNTHFATTLDSRNPTRCALWAPIEWPQDLPGLSEGRLSKQDDYVFWALPTEANKALISKDGTLNDKLSWIDTVTSDWDARLRVLFQEQDTTALTILPVYSSCPDFEEWEINPCVTFLGDAIHAMSPTGGVGGRTAIMDARDLCMAIVATKDSESNEWIEALRKYEDDMRARAKPAVERSFTNAKWMWQGKDWWEYERTI